MDDAKVILEGIKADPQIDISPSIGQYQLRPTLLDPIIPQSIDVLARDYLSTHAKPCLHNIYAFCSVRGSKLVLQNFPTDAYLITRLRNDILHHANSDDWKQQYVTLLWLSAVVLSPFDLNTIEPNLFDSLYNISLKFLAVSGIQREASSTLMARLLTRGPPASHAPLVDKFVLESMPYLRVDVSGHGNDFRSIGSLQVLAVVLDRTPIIPPQVRQLINQAAELVDQGGELWFYGHTVIARNWIKVLGRSGLLNMGEFAELVVAECMTLLDNKSTKIRMSAAKYLARISHKLDMQGNSELADEVTDAVIGSLKDEPNMESASCDYWSGALLALAEIARRRRRFTSNSIGVLVDVLTSNALHFIQKRLKSQIGSNVRDAACYVCWSLFRYVKADQLLRKHRLTLYATLVNLACLDSEVNVRRAAAAALQEGLGRFGSSHGDLEAEDMFNLMNKINFHTVSLVTHCYCSLGPDFCLNSDAFAQLYIHHGLNHSSADFRRMAANAVTKLNSKLHTELIDLLLNDNNIDLHGRMLALGAIYTTGSDYRINEARELLSEPDESDVNTESNLRLLHISPDRVVSYLSGIVSEDANVIASAEDLMGLLSTDIVENEIIPLCERKMAENRLFVACLVRASQTPEHILLRASHLTDPKSRALVASRLTLNNEEISSRFLAFLNDYTIDERGDVGSWVREGALRRLQQLIPVPISARKVEIENAVWRVASESTQKIRQSAAQTLFRLGLLPQELDSEDTARYYCDLLKYCPDSSRLVVARGVASSVGAIRASASTIEGSFRGLIQYLKEMSRNKREDGPKEIPWILEAIMGIERASQSNALDVVRTLKRLVLYGYNFGSTKRRVLAIAYNTTLVSRFSEQLIMDAVDILQVYADWSPQAFNRLLNMVKVHRLGPVRQRCADALFELGVDNEVLEITDWTSTGFLQYAKKLAIETK